MYRVLLLLTLLTSAVAHAANTRPPGLVLTLRAGPDADSTVTETVALHVAADEPPTPWLRTGPFTATWEGFVSSELRSEYTFHATGNGRVRLAIQGTTVLDAEGRDPGPVSTPRPVRLNKGPNAIRVEFTSPPQGDAVLRLSWSNRETPAGPIPPEVLSHDPTPGLARSSQWRHGRALVVEHHCTRCHDLPGATAELRREGPTLAGIGSRRNRDWMERWILNPRAMRDTATMPAVFHGPDAAGKAQAVAAYLASLKAESTANTRLPSGIVVTGRSLYEKLHCIACHDPPDRPGHEQGRIPHSQVRAKFVPGTLAAYLLDPARHHPWTRMPHFRLTPDEAANLAAYLDSLGDPPPPAASAADAALIDKGRSLVAASGCLNCHPLPGTSTTLRAPALHDIAPARWTAGCLAPNPAPDDAAPAFGFTEVDRAAIQALATTDRRSLTQQTAVEYLERQSGRLRCRECHGKFEGFPAWELLPGKLKPEWAAAFLAGTERTKPRTWIDARMPAFPADAALLAEGLAKIRGFPARTPQDPPADAELAAAGRRLVGASGGFACVSCHGAGSFAATQVFEAPGVNFALSHARLQPDWFRRWVRSPISIDPSTKMPVYFDEEGRSPLPDVLGGDGPRTLQALWEYLRLGPAMPRPE